MNCKLYCMAISAFSIAFLFFIFFLVVFDSKTLYIEIHNHASSAVAILISIIIYSGIFGYLYYDLFICVDRKEELKKWIKDRRNISNTRQLEIRERERGTSFRESSYN